MHIRMPMFATLAYMYAQCAHNINRARSGRIRFT